jgi:hypothetical protein
MDIDHLGPGFLQCLIMKFISTPDLLWILWAERLMLSGKKVLKLQPNKKILGIDQQRRVMGV